MIDTVDRRRDERKTIHLIPCLQSAISIFYALLNFPSPDLKNEYMHTDAYFLQKDLKCVISHVNM